MPKERKLVDIDLDEVSGVDHPAHLSEGWLVMKNADLDDAAIDRLISEAESIQKHHTQLVDALEKSADDYLGEAPDEVKAAANTLHDYLINLEPDEQDDAAVDNQGAEGVVEPGAPVAAQKSTFGRFIDWMKGQKTEKAAEEPALKALAKDAYAYTPSDNEADWKLPLWPEGGTAPTAAQVGRAIAALGKGFRGQKVEIPSAALPAVKAKVRKAWREANPDAKESDMPAVLKSAEVEDTTKAMTKCPDCGHAMAEGGTCPNCGYSDAEDKADGGKDEATEKASGEPKFGSPEWQAKYGKGKKAAPAEKALGVDGAVPAESQAKPGQAKAKMPPFLQKRLDVLITEVQAASTVTDESVRKDIISQAVTEFIGEEDQEMSDIADRLTKAIEDAFASPSAETEAEPVAKAAELQSITEGQDAIRDAMLATLDRVERIEKAFARQLGIEGQDTPRDKGDGGEGDGKSTVEKAASGWDTPVKAALAGRRVKLG